MSPLAKRCGWPVKRALEFREGDCVGRATADSRFAVDAAICYTTRMEGKSKPAAGRLREQAFRIGEYLIEPRRNRISGPTGATSLQPRIIDVLCALAERQGEVLSRAELIDSVWRVEHGADESLTRAISQLRKVFADAPGDERFIETIAKRGYRLAAAVRSAREQDTSVAPRTTVRLRLFRIAASALLVVLVVAAVLALRVPEEEPEAIRSERTGIVVTVEPFGTDGASLAVAGLTDELGTAIARSPLIRVRTASTPAPGGEVQYRLRGEVHRVDDQLRINAQVLDSATGEVVWGERYDRPNDAQFSARDDVVAAITRDSFYPLLRAAKAKLVHRPALSLVPWELTLFVTWVPGDERMFAGPPTEDSYWLQRRALELDSDFAPAHALFAQLASWHALFDPPSNTPRALARARHHAERAVELAPYDAEVLYQLALYYTNNGDRDRVLATLDRVLELQPNHPLARIDRDFVAGQCQADSDAAVTRLTTELNALPVTSPARWVALSHLSSLYLARGEFERAREAALASRRINPSTRTALTLAAANAELGADAEALATMAAHRREWPNLDLAWFAEQTVPRWCFNGSRTARVQSSFRKLARLSTSAS
jgi:DNA-binding winged helix-turn-helix (wHTH) protein/TolB-like protein